MIRGIRIFETLMYQTCSFTLGFEELTCECGTNVLYPPIRCGTKPPACDQPCPRGHPCEHPVNHNCHSDPNCPPCTVLTRKFCYGQHEVRLAVYMQPVFLGAKKLVFRCATTFPVTLKTFHVGNYATNR